MSEADSDSELPDQQEDEHNGIIFPIAPKPSLENAEQIGINSTPAFQCIDDVCKSNFFQ